MYISVLLWKNFRACIFFTTRKFVWILKKLFPNVAPSFLHNCLQCFLMRGRFRRNWWGDYHIPQWISIVILWMIICKSVCVGNIRQSLSFFEEYVSDKETVRDSGHGLLPKFAQSLEMQKKQLCYYWVSGWFEKLFRFIGNRLIFHCFWQLVSISMLLYGKHSNIITFKTNLQYFQYSLLYHNNININ